MLRLTSALQSSERGGNKDSQAGRKSRHKYYRDENILQTPESITTKILLPRRLRKASLPRPSAGRILPVKACKYLFAHGPAVCGGPASLILCYARVEFAVYMQLDSPLGTSSLAGAFTANRKGTVLKVISFLHVAMATSLAFVVSTASTTYFRSKKPGDNLIAAMRLDGRWCCICLLCATVDKI